MSYCTVEDFRGEGITEEEYSDEQLEKLIALSCNFIDDVTGQWFEPREKIIRLDGRAGQNLILPVFLPVIEFVKVGGEFIDDYVLYNRIQDRAYPKIFRNARWPKGIFNIEVSGTWGYVEEDLSTPYDIKRAAMRIALMNFPALNDTEAQEENNLRGLLVSETTDGHSYSLSGNAVENLYESSITGDVEIDKILRRYRRSKIRMAIA